MADAERLDADRWMARALELARRGVALAHPNPMVGATLVQDGRAVGEGFHTYDGLRHAEIVALEQAGSAARGATLYLNLEPCCHTGRTNPCVDAIIAAGVRRIVAAMADPNPAVAGRSIERLRAAGIKVETGVREAEAQRLNEAFARWITTHRPLVTLKSGLTLDGQIASPNHKEKRITSEQSRAEVQKLRHAADAVLTGIGTILADDPLLTDRTGRPRRRPLVRVVLDSRLRLPLHSKLVQSAAGDVLVFTTQSPEGARARALHQRGVEVVRVRTRKGRPDLRTVVVELGRREILGLLVEAGPRLNWAALEGGIVDKVLLFYAPKILGGNPLPVVRGKYRTLAAAPALKNLALRQCGPDFVVEGYFHDVYRNH